MRKTMGDLDFEQCVNQFYRPWWRRWFPWTLVLACVIGIGCATLQPLAASDLRFAVGTAIEQLGSLRR